MKQRLEELRELWEKANSGVCSEVSKSDAETMLKEVELFNRCA